MMMMRGLGLGLLVAVLTLAGVVAYAEVTREREYRRLISQGDTALGRDETFAAIEAFSGAIALKPQSMLPYFRRGQTYRRRNDSASALRDLTAAARMDQAATRPLEEIGDLEYSARQFDAAATTYAAYVRLDDRSPRLLYKLALARYHAGLPGEAIVPLRQALRLNDRFIEAYYLLALALRTQGDVRSAPPLLLSALRLDPRFVQAREELADVYAALGSTSAHIEQLDTLASQEPDRPERFVTLGLAHAAANRPDLAVTALGGAAARFPQDPMIYAALGRVWLQSAEATGDRIALIKAIEALRTAAAAPAPTSEALALYGRAVLRSGDPTNALRILRRAVQQWPVAPAAYLDLATASERLRLTVEARDSLIRYVMLTPDDSRVATHARHIAELSTRVRQPAVAAEWLRAKWK